MIVLIKQFTIDLYSLSSYITISINRFTQKFDCFQRVTVLFFFYFLSISLRKKCPYSDQNNSKYGHLLRSVYEVGKNKWQNVNCRPYHDTMSIFLGSKIFQAILADPDPPKK